MKLLVYAITRGLIPVRGVGIDGAPLHRVCVGGLAAVVSHHADAPSATGPVLLQYEQVIERLMIDHEILPARFGSVFATEASIRDMLRERRDELAQLLGRVGGAVEFAVSAGWPEDDETAPAPTTESGTAYMLDRLAQHRRVSAVTRRLDPLNDLARSTRQRLLPRATLPIAGAYLVDTNKAAEFAALVRRLGDQLSDIELVCTGPWPPYTFAQGASI